MEENNIPIQNSGFPQENIPPMPKTWLVESILVTLLCCLPFGIVGIIKASKVETFYYRGMYEEARRASSDARTFILIGVILGFVFIVLYLALILVGAFSSMADMEL